MPGVNFLCDAGGSAASSIAGSVIGDAAQSFSDALAKLTTVLLTFWTDVDIPDLNDPSGPVAFIRNSTGWLTAFILILSLMVAGGKMAITQNFEAGKDAAKGIWQMVLYAGAGVPGIALLGIAGDKFSSWIIQQSTGGDFGSRLTQIFALSSLSGIGAGVILILAFLGILAALAQMALMIIRVGMLVLLAGMLPMSAAAAVGTGGKAWFSKNMGWLLAFLAYKPAAAVVYAAAFAMVGKGDDVVTVLGGMFLLALSVLALPALLRLAVPVTAGIAGGGAGAGAASVAAGGAVASGAMQMRSMGGSGGSQASTSSTSGGGPTGSPHSPGGRGAGGQGSAAGQGAVGAGQSGGAAAGATAGKGAAAAGAAGGPVGAGIGAGVQVMQAGVSAARGAASTAAGDGPDGADGAAGKR